jgi:hypothetical protein
MVPADGTPGSVHWANEETEMNEEIESATQKTVEDFILAISTEKIARTAYPQYSGIAREPNYSVGRAIRMYLPCKQCAAYAKLSPYRINREQVNYAQNRPRSH